MAMIRKTPPRGLIILFLIAALVAQAAVSFAAQNPVKIIAHRGANKFAPENTIPAIEKAIEMGLDYVEMDIRETADGELVLMHNSTVDARTDGEGAVSEMTLAEIKKLDAGAKFGKGFAGTRVPTLREAFGVMRGKIGGYLDFKAGPPKLLVEIIEENGMVDDVVVYAGLEELMQVRKLNKKIKLMPGLQSAEQMRQFKKTMDLKVVETSVNYATKEFIDEAHESGIMVFMDVLGLLDNSAGMRRALKLGVDGIQTDHPDVLLKVLRGKKKIE